MDEDFLKLAIKTGKRGKVKGISPYEFGAVVVKDGKVIAKDYSHTRQRHDPSAHAEISAIKKAAKKLKDHNLSGCTLYASHEPCLMCFACAAWAEIDRIVYATAAAELADFDYALTNYKLEDLAKKLIRRPIKIDRIKLNG